MTDDNRADNRTPAELYADWAERAAQKAVEVPHAAGHYRTVSRYWRDLAADARRTETKEQ